MYGFLADAALVAVSSAYAQWLAEHKRFEPDWTWIEVGFGVGYCLIHAYARAAHHGGDWRDGIAQATRSLILGGIPVAAGEVGQWRRRAGPRKTYRPYQRPDMEHEE